MTANDFCFGVLLDSDEDKEILKKAKEVCNSLYCDIRSIGQTRYSHLNIQKFSQIQESHVEIDKQWTSYTAIMIEGHPTDYLIVFRPLSTRKSLGCIRIYCDSDKKLWDKHNEGGTWIGRVPKDCPVEAMRVEVKTIKLKEDQS